MCLLKQNWIFTQKLCKIHAKLCFRVLIKHLSKKKQEKRKARKKGSEWFDKKEQKSHYVRSWFAQLNFVFLCSSSLRFYVMIWRQKLLTCADNYRDDFQSWRFLSMKKSNFKGWEGKTEKGKRNATLRRTITLCRKMLWRCLHGDLSLCCNEMDDCCFFSSMACSKFLLMNHWQCQIESDTKTNFFFITF